MCTICFYLSHYSIIVFLDNFARLMNIDIELDLHRMICTNYINKSNKNIKSQPTVSIQICEMRMSNM